MILTEMLMSGGKIIETNTTKLPNKVLCRVVYPICNLGSINANRRIYGKDVWETVLSNSAINEQMKNRTLFGHSEHPEGTQSKTPLISHVITKMWIEENKAYAEIDVLDTPEGRIIDTLLEAGCNIGVSTRAEGDLREDVDDDGGKCYYVIAEAYKYITTDFTADPSTFGVLPIDIRRNVVSTIRKEVENVEAKPEEKKFAVRLLESMDCCDKKMNEDRIDRLNARRNELDKDLSHSKKEVDKLETQIADLDDEILGIEMDKKAGKNKSKKANEGQVTMVAGGDDGSVAVTGDVKKIIVDPQIQTAAPGGAIDVTVLPKDQQVAVVTITKVETIPPPDRVLAASPVDGTQPVAKEDEPDISDDDTELSDEDFEKEVDLDSEDVEESKISESGEADSGKEGPRTDHEMRWYYDVKLDHPGWSDMGLWRVVDAIIEEEAKIDAGLAAKGATGEVKQRKETDESKVNECKDVKVLYEKAGFKPPKGKGIHTKAFHKCVINYAGKIKSGKMKKDEACKRCMGGLGKKNAVKKAHRKNESIIQVVDYINELLNEKRGPWGERLNKLLYDAGYNVTEDQIVEIVDKISDNIEDWDKLTNLLSGEDAEAVVGFLQKNGLKLNKVEESVINEEKDLIFVADTKFKNDKFGVYRKQSGSSPYLLFSFPIKEKAIEMGKTIATMLAAEFSETKPDIVVFDSKVNEGILIRIDTENEAFAPDANVEIARILKRLSDEVSASDWTETRNLRDVNGNKVGTYQLTEAKTPSVLAKEIMELQIKEAVARAERDTVVEALNGTANKDLEVRILTKKLKESGDTDESLAIRSKLEEKAKAEQDLMSRAVETGKKLDALGKEINKTRAEAARLVAESEKEVAKLTKERTADAATIEKMKKDNLEGAERRDRANEEKTALVKEYVTKQLNEGLKVSDDHRALLESCQTIGEVDKAIDECRDTLRRRALHAGPLDRVIIEKFKQPVDPLANRQRMLINSVLKPKA